MQVELQAVEDIFVSAQLRINIYDTTFTQSLHMSSQINLISFLYVFLGERIARKTKF